VQGQPQQLAAAATDVLAATGAAHWVHPAKLHWQQWLLQLLLAHLAQQGALLTALLLLLLMAVVE
jgi:hypothetical protein